MRQPRDDLPKHPNVSLDELLMLLAGTLRLRIFRYLAASGQRDVKSIAEALSVHASNVSRSLGELMKAGLVEMRIEKKLHVYHLSGDVLVQAVNSVSITIPTSDDNRLMLRLSGSEGDSPPTEPVPKPVRAWA